jgi:hypothetical protein
MVISTISFVVSIYTHNKYIMMIFGILYIFPIVLNYNSSIDLIIFIGLYIALVAKFMKNDKYLRLLIMLASVFFISYNLLVFTPGGVLLEIIFL